MPANIKPGINGAHGQHRDRTDNWLTPSHILAALGGWESFDLDPCAAPEPRPWPTAKRHVTLPDNGLAHKWGGRVFLNPPYGAATGIWLDRLAEHGNGVALIFARTDTRFWHRQVVAKADAILFIEGRLTFHRPDGEKAAANSGGPSALVAYGRTNCVALWALAKDSIIAGHFTELRES